MRIYHHNMLQQAHVTLTLHTLLILIYVEKCQIALNEGICGARLSGPAERAARRPQSLRACGPRRTCRTRRPPYSVNNSPQRGHQCYLSVESGGAPPKSSW